MSSCPSEAQLAAYVADDCDEQTATTIAQHLDQCARCRRRIERQRDNNQWLAGELAAVDTDRIREEAKKPTRTLDAPPEAPTAIPTTDESVTDLIHRQMLDPCPEDDYPARLGPYKIISVIGEGGMGIVLKAFDEDLERVVALEILKPHMAGDKGATARFQREAKAAAALNHPNIVTIYAVEARHGTPYIAMEYVAGPSLRDVLRVTGPLPADLIRPIFDQLLRGLAAAHEAGLIHRDIKPGNILLNCGLTIADCGLHGVPSFPEETVGDKPTRLLESAIPISESSFVNLQSSIVKLADFGLARMITSQTRITQEGSTPGTPAYMSPEQARGDTDIDHRTDLYSAGVVLYEMLTGQTPFKAKTPSAIVRRILDEHPADPRSFRKGADLILSRLALRLMEKRREDRLESADQVLKVLETGRAVASPHGRRRLRKHLAIGFAALVLLCAGAWMLNRLDVERRISEVGVEMEGGGPTTTIRARYGDSLEWERFYPFPPEVKQIQGVQTIDLDGDGEYELVVAGVAKPLNGKCLFAFSPEKDIVQNDFWPAGLSSERTWPDCARPTEFGCTALARGDLDGRPGDEIVVAACNVDEYPTRLSIIDPRKAQVRSTFWHFGRIAQVLVVEDFLGPGRPAIITKGPNNKLDGFDEWKIGDHDAITCWDQVEVVMIIDPSDVTGERLLNIPPSTHRVEIPAVLPHAYAFWDGPYAKSVPDVSAGREAPRLPELSEVVSIDGMVSEQCSPGESAESCIGLFFKKGAGRGTSGARVTVNHNLEICQGRVIPTSKDESGRATTDEAYWRQHWRVIVQNEQYLIGAFGEAASSSTKPQSDQGP